MKKTVIKAVCLISSFIMLIVTACGCQSVDGGKQPSSTKPSSQAASSDVTSLTSSTDSAGSNVSSKPISSTAPVEVVEPERTYGNLPGNLNNYGIAAKQGEWTYYSTPSGLYKISERGSRARLCEARSVNHINVSGGWIYFIDDYKIYKIRTNGRDYQLFADTKAYFLSVVNGWAYYTPTSFGSAIYRTPVDKFEPQVVVSETVYHRCVMEDRVYYQLDGDLYSSKLDGSNRIWHGDVNTQGMMFYNGYKYTTGNLDKSYADGSNLVRLVQSGAFNVTIENDWIYYTLDTGIGERQHHLYKMKIDGSNNQKLSSNFCDYVNIVGDWIYFMVGTNKITIGSTTQMTYQPYRMKTDGSNLQKLD